MSTRQLPKIALGVVALFLVATGVFVISQQGRQESHLRQIRLAQDQPQLIQELIQEADRLSEATTLVDVNQGRYRLGSAVVRFDQVLASLLNGGYLEQDPEARVRVAKVENAAARSQLEDAARLWLETGVSLADLAAGEFSVFSAAGQEAIRSLATNQAEMSSLFQQTTVTLQQSQEQQQVTLAYARWLAMGLGALFLVMGFLTWRAGRPRPQVTETNAADPVLAGPAPVTQETNQPPSGVAPAATRPAYVPPDPTLYTGKVDFDNLKASVDNLSVDLGTISTSTEKMHRAIESVSHGMQGLLYSLKEMADSTAEDARILHNANNAAGFTTESSAELAASAREMSKVVDKVTQLALKTKQIAGSLETDSIQLDPESDTHTSVVAAEIQQLAKQTGHATGDIELTVSTILTTARLYDEAIGQIIKNVSKINQISQNLGCMVTAGPPVLAPPQRATQGQSLAQMPLAPAAQAEPVDEVPPPTQPKAEPEPEIEPEDESPDPGITDELSEALSAIKEVQTAAPDLSQPDETLEPVQDQAEDPQDAEADPQPATEETSDQTSENVFIFDTTQQAKTEAESETPAPEPPAEEIDLTTIEAPADQEQPELDEPEKAEEVAEASEEKSGAAEKEDSTVFIMP